MKRKKKWLVSKPSGTALRCLTLAASVGFLLAGCGPDLVATPINVKSVPGELMKEAAAPKCLPDKPEYTVPELETAVVCERGGARTARSQLRALQRAVKAREAAIRAIKQTP